MIMILETISSARIRTARRIQRSSISTPSRQIRRRGSIGQNRCSRRTSPPGITRNRKSRVPGILGSHRGAPRFRSQMSQGSIHLSPRSQISRCRSGVITIFKFRRWLSASFREAVGSTTLSRTFFQDRLSTTSNLSRRMHDAGRSSVAGHLVDQFSYLRLPTNRVLSGASYIWSRIKGRSTAYYPNFLILDL